MDLDLEDRTAPVCASTRGLGEAIARALAAEGASVVVSERRGERARAIAGELPGAVGVEVDLTEPDGPAALYAAAVEAHGDVDILVLNGPGPKPAAAADLASDDVTAAVDALVRPAAAAGGSGPARDAYPRLGSDPGGRFQQRRRRLSVRRTRLPRHRYRGALRRRARLQPVEPERVPRRFGAL